MGDTIALDFDLGRRHAARVGQVAADVRMAQDAASSLNLAGGAFGVMCAFLVPPAVLVSQVAIGTISSVSAMLGRAETEFLGMVSDFEATEEEFSGRYKSMHGALGVAQ
ncbi:hypothetical protein [Microbacterium panaciterrae]|uniref:Excreted virulence factor EspC, type VII ESX diderm n=1 Tax=Microbacterium panaciterrae TaxID=985759 RepID=A0ABP8P629_9MICO